jgi:peptide deformylase
MQDGEEGCLSFPELRYETPRAMRAVAQGFNMYGEPITVEGTEFLARALQHETDHLNGILFIDKLSVEDRKLAMKESPFLSPTKAITTKAIILMWELKQF